MIRQTVRSLALAALGLALASGAWGQSLRQSASMPAMVALEYFGAAGGREIEASGFDLDSATTGLQRPYVALTPTAAISVGNVADITFTLTGATFSQTVSPANLDRRSACTSSDTTEGLSISVAGGGARTDSSVTFRVEATAAFDSSAALCFWVPNLQATLANLSPPGTPPADQMMGVAVTATIKQGVTNSNPFPARISGPAAADVDTDSSGSVDGAEVGNAPNAPSSIFIGERALVTSLGDGGMAMVALADRSKIASGGTPDPSASDPKAAAMGLLVGTLSVKVATNAATEIWQLDGGGFVVDGDDLDGSLGGQVMLSVGGPFQDGDKVVFDLPGESTRSVTPSGGMASTSVELAPDTTTPIVYVPGGTGVLRPAKFAAMAKYAFNSLDNNSALPIMASVGSITYQGITVQAYAYGVVRGGGMDTSYGRATCEAASGMCQLFADCTDQDGTAHFGGPVPIAAGATAVIDSDALAGALGGGWDKGRGRCDIWSTAPLAFQHMVRSHGLLINNSAVVGRGLDENADDSIQGVVDRICASVGMGDGLQDGDDDPENPGTPLVTDVDTVCTPVDTMPPPASG